LVLHIVCRDIVRRLYLGTAFFPTVRYHCVDRSIDRLSLFLLEHLRQSSNKPVAVLRGSVNICVRSPFVELNKYRLVIRSSAVVYEFYVKCDSTRKCQRKFGRKVRGF
jgi:hypothetical protein